MINLQTLSARSRSLWQCCWLLGALGCGAAEEAQPGTAEELLAPAGSNSELVSASFKPEWYPGERVRVSFSLRNSGSIDWTTADPTFALGSLDRGWDWRNTATAVTVPPGSSHDFDFVVSAPTTPGDYSFMARMRALGLGDFGATITRAATVTPSATPQWGCAYVASASSVPTELAPNENRSVVVTVRNVGQETWQPGFYLVSEDSPAGLWHQTSRPLDEAVAPGASKTWSLGIRAPATPGAYRLRREMRDGTAGGVGEFRRSNYCVDLAIDVTGNSPLDSSLSSQDFPSTVAPGEAFVANVVLHNTGTESWLADGSYVLGYLNTPASLWGRTSVPVTTAVAPGASVNLTLRLTAPATPGSYQQAWQLRRLSGTNAGYFGATVIAPVVVDQAATPGYGASVVDQKIAARMTVGKAYPVQISMKNTGSSAWSGASFGLISTNLPKGLWTKTLSSLAATESVVPDGTRTFSFQVIAPVNVGSYSSSWRMAQSGVGLFGQTALSTIEVTSCGNGVVDASEGCDDGNLAGGDGCSPTCQRECGNGQIDAAEQCDGANLGGATCDSVTSGAKPGGTLTCTAGCTFDDSACSASCVDRKLLGTYALQAHNVVSYCKVSDLSCATTQTQDATATFSLFAARGLPRMIQGKFHGPGLKLHDAYSTDEIWDVPALIYYPPPGDSSSIWSQYYPAGMVGEWDESRAGAWVRVMLDTCFEEFRTGFVHIDIELATGRILNFARRCDVDYMTFWDDYRMTGTGQLACPAGACNDVANTASPAELVTVTEPETLRGCQLTSGTYHLISVHYVDDAYGECAPIPTSMRETLVIDASSATTGTLSLASEESPFQPFTATSSYRSSSGSYENLQTSWSCGPEELAPLYGLATCSTSGNELSLQLGRDGCSGSATYIYQKQ